MTGSRGWQERAQEALARTEIMVLATTDAASGTWASPVQFQAGGNLGLQITGHAARQGDDSGGWRRYTVRPAEVWCFDSRIDHERHRISIQLLL